MSDVDSTGDVLPSPRQFAELDVGFAGFGTAESTVDDLLLTTVESLAETIYYDETGDYASERVDRWATIAATAATLYAAVGPDRESFRRRADDARDAVELAATQARERAADGDPVGEIVEDVTAQAADQLNTAVEVDVADVYGRLGEDGVTAQYGRLVAVTGGLPRDTDLFDEIVERFTDLGRHSGSDDRRGPGGIGGP